MKDCLIRSAHVLFDLHFLSCLFSFPNLVSKFTIIKEHISFNFFFINFFLLVLRFDDPNKKGQSVDEPNLLKRAGS